MLLILEIAFWLCIVGVTITYFIYPFWIKWLGLKQSENNIRFSKNDALPVVAIIVAAYNEEKVIAKKLDSILQLNYPKELIHVFIGNDCSTDSTAAIVESYQSKIKNLTLVNNPAQTGKTAIVNHLGAMAKSKLGEKTILVLTDANVLFHVDLLFELVQHFKNKTIGIVGANVVNTVSENSVVGELETMYISRENKMKYYEGLYHGALMGTFGACYAIRATALKLVPEHFLMEDFYITMQVHNQKLKCIFEMNAICYEDVPGNMWEEFKRKSRIAAGNFQNFFVFKNWLLKPFSPVGFTFICHKVLRWFTPFLAIAGLILVWILSESHLHHDLYDYIFWYKFIFWGLFFLDLIFVYANIHFKPLRLLTYFYFMNVAILVGFYKYVKGIKSAAWKPPTRNVND